MKINLAGRIREFRKECGMTQEQLAEALGVTVGAVYKWENGRSTPEVRLLTEMADLFETSVDALLDYQVRNNDCKHLVERLKAATHDRPDNATLLDAEKAIRKYPNCFDIIYYSAVLYELAGIVRNDPARQRRALALYQKALLLIEQNTDDKRSALSIQTDMANIHSCLGEQDKGIALLKASNPMGVNNARIGAELAQQGQPEQAARYLSEALVDVLVKQFHTVDGFLNVLEKQNDNETMLALLHWVLNSIHGLQMPGVTSFLDRMEAVYLMVLAYVTMKTGARGEAAEHLRQAKRVALRFDAEPDYSVKRIRFVDQNMLASAFDSMGTSAIDGICTILRQQESPELDALWEEIDHEAE